MIESFKNDLRVLSSTQIVRKYILSGPVAQLDFNVVFQLRERIADYFDVEFSDVILVGSSKLGFSIKPDKRYLSFGDDSDIDVAVVSTLLFQKVWREAFLFKNSRAYWPTAPEFFKYLTRGWIRPDMLPRSPSFAFTQNWWDFFNELSRGSEFGRIKIRGGLYHSWFFLLQYQLICTQQCIEELTNGNIGDK